jgi:tetratricopeptide (TPR) repeat protein
VKAGGFFVYLGSISIDITFASMKLIFILSFIPLFNYALNQDSLESVLKSMPDDTAKVNLVNRWLKYNSDLNAEYKLELARRMLYLSDKYDYDVGKISCYWVMSRSCNYRVGGRDSAFYFINQALKVNVRGNQSNHFKAISNFYKGLIFHYENAYDSALKYYKIAYDLEPDKNLDVNLNTGLAYDSKKEFNKALEIYKSVLENSEDVHTISRTYSAIAFNYYSQKKFKKSVEYLEKDLEIELNGGNNQYSIAGSYANIADCYIQLNQYDSAQQYLLKSIDIRFKLSDYSHIVFPLINLGNVNLSLLDTNKAMENFIVASQIADSSGNLDQMIKTRVSIADIYMSKKEWGKSLQYAKQLGALLDSITNKLDYGKEHIKLSTIFEKNRNTKEALKHLKAYTEIQDSLRERAVKSNILELQELYETEKKEAQIQLQQSQIDLTNADLAKEKQLRYSIGLIFVLISGFAYFLFYRYKQRQKLEKETERIKSKNNILELEQKLLLTQMNPHFIFNSLNSIKSFILKNESIKAADYLSDFAHLMRMILDSSRQPLISLDDERKILKYYLSLEQARLKGQFQFKFDIDDELELELDDLKIPPMLLQPFIENAVKHGFSDRSIKGLLEVEMRYKGEKSIVIKIRDNGVGRDSGSSNFKTHKSHALDITNERVAAFNETHSENIRYKINDLNKEGENSGTEIVFELPLIAA